MLSGAGWRGVEELHICLVLPVIFSRLFICMVDVTIFGFNFSFVQLQVVPCFSSGPTGKVWGPTSRSELPCYDSQPTVLYCCHCHCQGTGARYALTTAPGSFRCLGVKHVMPCVSSSAYIIQPGCHQDIVIHAFVKRLYIIVYESHMYRQISY